jgi:RNA polymerase sigma-70 factor (ECF subfamily)
VQAARSQTNESSKRASDDVRESPTTGAAPNSEHHALLATARQALACGETEEARRCIDDALKTETTVALSDEWAQLRDITTWPDAWLVAGVRRDPPDAIALDTLVERHWKSLFARCQMLTLNTHNASDLAQDTWCRLLRARQSLKPDGNLPAYLATIATNLWRDKNRSAQRAGPMAGHRLASLDNAISNDQGETVVLADVLPDVSSLDADERRLLMLDLDQALEKLTPLLREVVVSRFLDGESCAEIGQRHGRTEQTVSGWVRQAIREMKIHLEELYRGIPRKENL